MITLLVVSASTLLVMNCSSGVVLVDSSYPSEAPYGCDTFNSLFSVVVRSAKSGTATDPTTIEDASSSDDDASDAAADGSLVSDASTNQAPPDAGRAPPTHLLLTISPIPGSGFGSPLVSSMKGTTVSMARAEPNVVTFIEGRAGAAQVDVEVLVEALDEGVVFDLSINGVSCTGYNRRTGTLSITLRVTVAGRRVVAMTASVAEGQPEDVTFAEE